MLTILFCFVLHAFYVLRSLSLICLRISCSTLVTSCTHIYVIYYSLFNRTQCIDFQISYLHFLMRFSSLYCLAFHPSLLHVVSPLSATVFTIFPYLSLSSFSLSFCHSRYSHVTIVHFLPHMNSFFSCTDV